MQDAQLWQVKLFLFQFKEFAQDNFKFVEREKCLDTIARIGITVLQAKAEIMGLTHEDYCRGPIPDTGPKGGELWEFGKTIEGGEIFIRLKVVLQNKMAKCQSFHIAEKPLQYPYKGGEKRNECSSVPQLRGIYAGNARRRKRSL